MLKELVRGRLRAALTDLEIDGSDIEIEVVTPSRETFGDLSSNLALALSARLNCSPREIGDRILKAINPQEFETIHLDGPGFLNFTLKRKTVLQVLEQIVHEREAYGTADLGGDRKVQLEFVSSNPTGPLTVGHGRQAALGDVLSNLYENLGYRVTREYYFNDSGHQIDLLGRSLWVRYQQALGEAAEIPEGGYSGDYLVELARGLVAEIGDRYRNRWDGTIASTFRVQAVSAMIARIRDDLKRFGVEFDVWFKETQLHEPGPSKIDDVLEELRDAGAIYEQDGALWLKTTAYGADQDRVVRKRTGEYTYLMTDIAYHVDKWERGFDRVIDIHGADHHGHIPPMQAAMRALGYPDGFLNYLLHQFVSLERGGQTVRMSTRRGEFVELRELIEELGRDVVRYFMIMRKPGSHLTFDYDLAKEQSMENPVYYIQYAHTRIAGIFRQPEIAGWRLGEGIGLNPLVEAEELDLIKKLDEFPKVVLTAAEDFAPHLLAEYAGELAARFHHFYNRHRVIGDDDRVTEARLVLVKGTQIVLRRALELMGVSAPERM